jgi:hypothetical protein
MTGGKVRITRTDAAKNRRFCRARDHECSMTAAFKRRIGQRDAVFGLHTDNRRSPTGALLERIAGREQRCEMAVFAQPEQIDLEQRARRIEPI